MRIHRLSVRKYGPLQDLDIRFGQATLIVGNNEDGKTSLLDLLVQQVFGQAPSGFAAELWVHRFEDAQDLTSEITDPIQTDTAQLLQALLTVRAGNVYLRPNETQEMQKQQFWDEDVRALFYGNDETTTRIQKHITRILGVSSQNSWLSELYAHLKQLGSVCEACLPNYRQYQRNVELQTRSYEKLRELTWAVQKSPEVDAYQKLTEILKLGQRYLEAIEQLQQTEALKSNEEITTEQLIAKWASLESSFAESQQNALRIQSQMTRLHTEASDIVRFLQSLGLNTDTLLQDALEPLPPTGMLLLLLGGVIALSQSILSLFPKALAIVNQFSPFVLTGTGVLLLTIGAGHVSYRFARRSLWMQYKQPVWTDRDRVFSLRERFANIYLENEKLRKELVKTLQQQKALAAEMQKFQQEHGSTDLLQSSHSQRRKSKQHQDALNEVNHLQSLLAQAFTSTHPDDIRVQMQKTAEQLHKLDAQKTASLPAKLLQERQALFTEQQRLAQANYALKEQTLATVNQALQQMFEAAQTEFVQFFYPKLLGLSLQNDLHNLPHLCEQIDKYMLRLLQDIENSEQLLQIYRRTHADLDKILAQSLGSKLFKHLFSRLTGGNYVDISYEIRPTQVDMYVQHHTGAQFSLETLSTATAQQFLLALRLSMAGHLLNGQTGVLLLDDAFLSFDSERRAHSIQVLHWFFRQGWQIIYLSINETTMEQIFKSEFAEDIRVLHLPSKKAHAPSE